MLLQSEDLQNLAYAIIQLIHNGGTVMILGGYIAATLQKPSEVREKITRLVLTGWILQGLSGAGFGITSYAFYQKLPEIGRIGSAMLLLKILCVAAGIALTGFWIFRSRTWTERTRNIIWNFSFLLAATALGAAAFLRWFS